VRQTEAAVDEHFLLFDAIRFKQVDNARLQMRSILLNAAKKRIWQDRPEMFDHII
jgi:GntR family galactonate operon transcriptional repressor